MLLAPPGFEYRDDEVAQRSHDLAPAAGADLTGVFAVDDVADEVQGFGAPAIARSRSIRHGK
jgi:hypothetical protein